MPGTGWLHRVRGTVRLQKHGPGAPGYQGLSIIMPKGEEVQMIRIVGQRMAMLGLGVLSVLIVAGAAAAELKVGDPAPPFSLPGSDGKTYSLEDFKGKSAVVVAWFPKAFTGGCIKECKSLRDHSKALSELKIAYFTASVDKPEDNKKFAEDLKLDYPILSDPDKTVATAYGVLSQRGFASRWTFYIDKEGIIRSIDKGVQSRTETAGPDVAAKVKELGLEGK
jgi:peroxiredoxin Q/BCP